MKVPTIKTFFSLISSSDIFGTTVEFKINKQVRSKTILGGILSILMIVLLCIMFAISSQDVIYKENPQICILGKQAIDDDSNQTGQMLAALMNVPQATFASKIVIEGQTATVTREVDGGLETIQMALPAVFTTDLRLNEPRYVTLPNIMKAKKKPLDIFKPDDLSVDVTPRIKTVRVTEPPKRQAGVMVPDIATLVDKLKNEAKVI